MMSPLAANRDYAVAGPDPAVVAPRPALGPGLAFGAGPHSCVGMRITRNLVRCAFDAFAALPPMQLDGDVVQGTGRAVRSIVSLPVRFGG